MPPGVDTNSVGNESGRRPEWFQSREHGQVIKEVNP